LDTLFIERHDHLNTETIIVPDIWLNLHLDLFEVETPKPAHVVLVAGDIGCSPMLLRATLSPPFDVACILINQEGVLHLFGLMLDIVPLPGAKVFILDIAFSRGEDDSLDLVGRRADDAIVSIMVNSTLGPVVMGEIGANVGVWPLSG